MCTLFDGGVSERPKEHASKACVGVTPPWVQIPPPPRMRNDELPVGSLLGLPTGSSSLARVTLLQRVTGEDTTPRMLNFTVSLSPAVTG